MLQLAFDPTIGWWNLGIQNLLEHSHPPLSAAKYSVDKSIQKQWESKQLLTKADLSFLASLPFQLHDHLFLIKIHHEVMTLHAGHISSAFLEHSSISLVNKYVALSPCQAIYF